MQASHRILFVDHDHRVPAFGFDRIVINKVDPFLFLVWEVEYWSVHAFHDGYLAGKASRRTAIRLRRRNDLDNACWPAFAGLDAKRTALFNSRKGLRWKTILASGRGDRARAIEHEQVTIRAARRCREPLPSRRDANVFGRHLLRVSPSDRRSIDAVDRLARQVRKCYNASHALLPCSRCLQHIRVASAP